MSATPLTIVPWILSAALAPASLPLPAASLTLRQAPAAEEPRAFPFGFSDFEIYEVGEGIFDLEHADLDGDGDLDLAFVNNGRSRIDLLLRLQPGDPAPDVEPAHGETSNPIEYDRRFRVHEHAVEQRVPALELADFDRDGRADLAYATADGEVSVVYCNDDGSPGRRERRKVDALRGGCQALTAADADGDGFVDLLAVGGGEVVLLPGLATGALGEAREIDRIDEGIDELVVADLDGNGTNDVLYVYHEQDYPLRARLRAAPGEQGQPGQLGPRTEWKRPQIRGACVSDLDGNGAAELAVVNRVSGRLGVYGLAEPDEDERTLQRYSFEANSERGQEPTFAIGDLDGNGTDDIVVAEAAAARVAVYSGRKGSAALVRTVFPSLVGVAHPCIGDVDGDGRAELLVVSKPERMLGVAALEERGSLPFPRTLPLAGEPSGLDIADMDGDGLADAVVLTTSGQGRSREYALEIRRGSPEGIEEEARIHPLAGLTKEPSAIRVGDVDRDGAPDVVAFLPGQGSVPAILVQRRDPESGEMRFVWDERAEEAPGLGVLEEATVAEIAFGDCDGDGSRELMICSGNFVRSLYFDADERGTLAPHVLEQINAPSADAAIDGCALVDLDGEGAPEIALWDARAQEILLFRRDGDGVAQPVHRIDAGRIVFRRLVAADLSGDGRAEVVCLGTGQLAVLEATGRVPALAELASHSPERERILMDRIVAADMNADGIPDLVVSEVHRNALLILERSAGPLEASAPRPLEHALGFRVFEERTFAGGGGGREPRELAACDLTGDGKTDLAVLVHDKLILYIQE